MIFIKTYRLLIRNIRVRITYLSRQGLTISLFLIFIAVSGMADEIYVGGTMEQDEVWTKNNTYIVFQDLRIPQNITLTIEPGVDVKINQGRGIQVYGGLIADGKLESSIDSIRFSANHTSRSKDWKWKGIIFIGVSEASNNIMSYVNITDAEVGIDIYISDHISIKNTSIFNSQQLGIRISNSNSIIVQNCNIQNSYDGIEMIVNDDQTTSNNLIDHCILKNDNHNIYIYKEFGGVLMENNISNNLIEGANNGIWMDKGGGFSERQNTIERNLLIDNGSGAGYGMLISLDSVIVNNNIFWKNHIAIFYEQRTKACDILNNSFYQNYQGIVLSDQSIGNSFMHNTFAVNQHTFFEMGESDGTTFKLNNIFANPRQENIVINNTEDDIEIDQNFWNTLNDTAIQKLIWDKIDDPELGLMIYNPFLIEADTANPISPPSLIKKQLVEEDQVKISWSNNPEKDFNSYRVYFGDFENYTFSDQFEVGTDTSVMLAGISIYDSIAVTSSDNANTVTNRQVLGHESPFAFASLYPYAGPDAIICKSVTEYKINKNAIPFPYQGLNWTTEGDGAFNNEYLKHPIYYPGTADVLEGTVVITLHTLFEGKTLSDSFILSIIGDPFVFAGNDTIVHFDADVDLVNSDALNYDHVEWISIGDGFFNNDTILNPIYMPGNQDISNEQVDLVLMADSECGSASDTLTVFLKPYYSVEGHLWYFNQKVNPGIVLAILDGVTGIKTMQSSNTNTEAYFSFDDLAAGSYYLYAVPDTGNILGAVPGYYANKLKWQEAYKLEVNADVYDIDIYLPSTDYQLPEGEASISGHFTMPASGLFASDIFCRSWFAEKVEYDFCRSGVSNITVFLYNSDATKLLDFTLTNRDGNFYFNHLPYGNYIVDAEKTGYQTTVSPVIGLSPEHKHETGIVLEVKEKKIGIYRSNITPPLATNNKVYPNPTLGELNLIMDVETEQLSGNIKIFNMFGQSVLKENITFDSPDKHFRVKLQLGHLPSGMYFGTVNNRNFTFIKH